MYSTVIRHPFNYVMPGATSKRNMKYRLSSDGISYVRSSLKADKKHLNVTDDNQL